MGIRVIISSTCLLVAASIMHGCEGMKDARCNNTYNGTICERAGDVICPEGCDHIFYCGVYASDGETLTYGTSNFPCACVDKDGRLADSGVCREDE